jgi:hypothetical protein
MIHSWLLDAQTKSGVELKARRRVLTWVCLGGI